METRHRTISLLGDRKFFQNLTEKAGIVESGMGLIIVVLSVRKKEEGRMNLVKGRPEIHPDSYLSKKISYFICKELVG